MIAASVFLFASRGDVNVIALLATVIGTSCIIAAGCVVNNYTDRAIDQKMDRTKKRALVTGDIPVVNALLFAAALSAIGTLTLGLLVNTLTLQIGIVGFFAYTVLYGWVKRRSIHGTLAGTISGATPPLAGYTAATNSLDTTALILFLILVVWQMPHFFAIALFRLRDYKAAGIPVLSVVKGVHATRTQIVYYIAAFTVITPLLTIYGEASNTLGIVMFLSGAWWLKIAMLGKTEQNYERWARKVFGFSLMILLIFSALLTLDVFLP